MIKARKSSLLHFAMILKNDKKIVKIKSVWVTFQHMP